MKTDADKAMERIVAELDRAAKTYRAKCRPWTEADSALVKKYYGKVPPKLLAEKLNRSIDSIQSRASKLRREPE